MVKTQVRAPIEKVWEYWTKPEYIMQWNAASPDWCCPSATNDVRVGGSLRWRMEARDKSMGFDFGGEYTEVIPQERLVYVLGDGRVVEVQFVTTEGGVSVTEIFDAEQMNPTERQRAGWQAILDAFKACVERAMLQHED